MMDTVEQAYAAARGVVGKATRVELGAVRARDLGRFQVAVSGSVSGPARELALDSRPHPLFVSSVLGWGTGPVEHDLFPDGNAQDVFAGLDLGGLRLMGGGQELTMHRELVPGAELVMEASIDDVSVRSGRLLVLVVLRRYFDGRGLLAECRETFLGRDKVT